MIKIGLFFRIVFKIIATNLVALGGLVAINYCFLLANGSDVQFAIGQTAILPLGMLAVALLYQIWKSEISTCFDVLAKHF